MPRPQSHPLDELTNAKQNYKSLLRKLTLVQSELSDLQTRYPTVPIPHYAIRIEQLTTLLQHAAARLSAVQGANSDEN